MPIYDKKVTALIGPSGCGKSTYLRSFNRMHDLYPGNRYEGEIRFFPDNTNLLSPDVDPIEVRMRVGMVFQKPNPFPKSIYENVAYGLRVRGENNKRVLDDKVEQALQGQCPVGRSQGSPAGSRLQPVRRPAAASVHRPRPGHRPRTAALRRADLSPRPDRHRRHRGTGA